MTARIGMRWVIAIATAGLLLAAACSGGDSDNADRATADHAGESQTSEDEASAGAVAEESDEAGSLEVDTVAVAQRDIVRTGDMTLTVDDFTAAAAEVRDAAQSQAGFVADEQSSAGSEKADLTVRVPAANFDDLRADVADLGEVVEQNVKAEDVTSEMVDVESRITSLRASVTRLQELLGGAGSVDQLAGVESELARRETELEALLGQQRLLEDQVDLATLTVHLTHEEEKAPETSTSPAGFRDGLSDGWDSAVDVARGITLVVGFALPFVVPGGIVAAAAVAWQRHRRRLPSPEAAG